jgi:thymidine kinase
VAGTKRRAEVSSRDGFSAAAIPIADLAGRFEAKDTAPDFLFVDEAQFLELRQIDALIAELGDTSTQLVMFGLYFEADGQPFPSAKQFKSMGVPMILAPKRLACRCERLAVADRRSLSKEGDVHYESVCLRHLRDAE